MRRSLCLIAAVTAAISLSAACGGGGGGSATPTPTGSGTPTPTGTQPPGGSFTPLKVNNGWTYLVTQSAGGATSTKTVTVTAFEDIGGQKAGTMGYKLHTADSSGTSQDEWHVDTGSVILRERKKDYNASAVLKSDTYYNPSKLYIDQTAEHRVQGVVYTEDYVDSSTDASTNVTTDTPHTITWTVLSTNESVTVAAGTFNCLKVHRVSSATGTTGADKIYWFAQGVGKVKENDPGIQTEELQSFTVVP